MKHSLHRAARVAGTRCSVPNCKKACAVDSDHCVHHRVLRLQIVPTGIAASDRIIYGS